jgi:hypothetical protein
MNGFFSGMKAGFKEFGDNITCLVNSVLLCLVYFIGVGPTSLFARLSGKTFIETKINKKTKTYWSDLDLEKRPIDEYYRQF